MTYFDPHEDPFYNGPELDGLSPDEQHAMRKRLRINARARRLNEIARKQDAQNERERAAIATGCAIAAIIAAITGLVIWHGI